MAKRRKTFSRLAGLMLAVFMTFNIMPAELLAEEKKNWDIWEEDKPEASGDSAENMDSFDADEEEPEENETEKTEENYDKLLGGDTSGLFSVDEIDEGRNAAPVNGGISPSSSGAWLVSGDTSGSFSSLELAVNAVNGDGGRDYTISNAAGNEILSDTVTVNSGKNVLLEGMGGIFTVEGNPGSEFLFEVKGTLTVKNIALKPPEDTGGVKVYSGGTFIMEEDSSVKGTVRSRAVYVDDGIFTMNSGEISGNSANMGPGVYISGSSGVFNLNGGSIKGNSGETMGTVYAVSGSTVNMNGGEISGNDANTGSAVYITGSATVFNLKKGIIEGNRANNSGTVYVTGQATMNMEGGSIKENMAADNGGGIYMNASSTLNMSGGNISWNNANTGGGIACITGKIYMETGEISWNNALYTYGGGIYMTNTEFIMIDSEIVDNTSASHGAGIYASGTNSKIIMEGSEISRNTVESTATNRYGGGVYLNQGSFNMDNSKVNNNTVKGTTTVYGGGFYLVNNAAVTVSASEIKGNKAVRGAGFYVTAGTFKIEDSSVIYNIAEGSGGGGCLAANENNELVIKDSDISNNEAGIHGAGIYHLGGALRAEKSKFCGNTAGTSGGAVYASAGSVNLNQCNLDENSGGGGGGAIYAGANAEVFLTNGSTANGNESTNTSGGAIYVAGGKFTMTDSEVIDNYSGITGGGIYSTGNFYMENVLVKENESKAYGGGVSVPGGSFEMIGSEIADNYAGTLGGGVYSAGDFQMDDTLIRENEAGTYGGGFASVNGAGNKIQNSRIIDNRAGMDGGGIYIAEGQVELTDSKINMNTAEKYGGGIYSQKSQVKTENTLIEENTAEISGGGIYADDNSVIEINSGAIKDNKSILSSGGGIFTENTDDYSNLSIGGPVLFSGNSAGFYCLPPVNAPVLYPTIQTVSASNGFSHPLNNFDINYYAEYTLQYNVNGGNGDGPEDEAVVSQYAYPLNITDIPTHPGEGGADVVFAGWTENEDSIIYEENDVLSGIITEIDIIGDTVVYALWGYDRDGNGIADVLEDRYSLTIKWESGGAVISGRSGLYKEGDLILIDAAAEKGYKFIGWKSSGGGIFGDADAAGTIFLMPAEDVIITACFEIIKEDNSGGDSSESRDGRRAGSSGGGYVTAGKRSSEGENNVQKVFSPLITEAHFAYIYGYKDGTIKGDNAITRAEAAAVFYRLLSVKGTADYNLFSDIAGDEWYAQSVNYLGSIQILRGYPDGTFKPNDFISRSEFAAMTAQFDQLELGELNQFTDVKNDHWAVRYINSAFLKGWVSGYPDGTFKPENSITRGEVVTIINIMLDRKIDEETLKIIPNPYKDITAAHWAYRDIIEASVSHEFTKDEEEVWISW